MLAKVPNGQTIPTTAIPTSTKPLVADYLAFMKEHNFVPSMSRTGNCYNNANVEIFNFIEMFFSLKKSHSHTRGGSPARFEEEYFSEIQTA